MPSRLHSKVDPDSVDVNENDADPELDNAGGADVIVVSGAVTSIVHENDDGDGSVLPAGSMARTLKVCNPSVSGPNVSPLVQAANGAPSTEHWNVAVLSVDENVNVGVELLDGLDGVESSDVSGERVSIVQVNDSGVKSVLPIESIALTWNVWEPSARPV